MKTLFSAAVMAVLLGCASAGHNFSLEQANRVANGMTREQVIQIMGTNPTTVANQGRTFIWSFAHIGLMGGTESRAARFSFDENGRTYGVPDGGVFGDAANYQKK